MKKKFILPIIAIILIIIGFYLSFENTSFKISNYEVINAKIPHSFDGYKIIQVSDFHNTQSEKLKNNLISEIKEQQPDIIVLTGDLVDSRRTDVDCAVEFVKNISSAAPVYYVPGNHESRISAYETLKKQLAEANVKILENDVELIEKNSSQINLAGIIDPDFAHESTVEDSAIIKTQLERLQYDKNNFTVLLSHRPEIFNVYCEKKIDLVFSGHAHGGQVRLPFIGGTIAPDQGFFPKYANGKFEENGTSMIVSRGIGNSLFPFRVNNRPDLVITTLKAGA